MQNKVIKMLTDKKKESGGHCGMCLIDFKLPFSDLKPILNKLHKEKIISVHDHQHGKLVKLI